MAAVRTIHLLTVLAGEQVAMWVEQAMPATAAAAAAEAAVSFNAIFSSIFCANDKKFFARIFSIFARPKKFHAL